MSNSVFSPSAALQVPPSKSLSISDGLMHLHQAFPTVSLFVCLEPSFPLHLLPRALIIKDVLLNHFPAK